jgi:hypothetical protein
MALETNNPFESDRIHENQGSAEEGARHAEPDAGNESVEGEHHRQGPPGHAEPERERPNSEGDRGLDGFK